ncbi:MAG TPA: E3 binding domain-containing protein, partial [Ferruginibacter sp.]|nr:E3 binding domain-containing protein [Ferruginibacter sp.]
MAEVIRMPRLSDTMTEGVIVAWNKKVGDKIKPGDVLAEVETDKATMELESYNEGTLLYIGVEKGKAVAVDGVLAVVGKEGEDYQSLLSGSNGKAAASAPAETSNAPAASPAPAQVSLPAGAKEIRMPLLSDTMTEGKIVAWHKKLGDQVKSDDVLADVETDKATMEVVGYEEGTLLYMGVEAGHAAKVNEIIAIVGKAGTDVSAYVASQKSGAQAGTAQASHSTAAPAASAAPVAAAQPVATAPSSDETGRIKASPLAKKLAQDKGIDLRQVQGSGDGGRITKRDIDNFVHTAPVVPAAQAQSAARPFTAQAGEGYTDIPLTQMRKTIARRLGE